MYDLIIIGLGPAGLTPYNLTLRLFRSIRTRRKERFDGAGSLKYLFND